MPAAAGRIREAVRNGGDPAETRVERHTLTFDALADLYIKRYAKQQKASWRADEGFLRQVRGVWGRRDAASITRQDAAMLVFDIAAKTPVSANRTRSVLLKMYGWAVNAALLDNNPISGTKKPHREGEGRSRILRDDEIRVLWRALNPTTPGGRDRRRAQDDTSARAASRRSQRHGGRRIARPRKSAAALWTVRRHRMKARKLHLVPLPPFAAAIVKPRSNVRRARNSSLPREFRRDQTVAQCFVGIARRIDRRNRRCHRRQSEERQANTARPSPLGYLGNVKARCFAR